MYRSPCCNRVYLLAPYARRRRGRWRNEPLFLVGRDLDIIVKDIGAVPAFGNTGDVAIQGGAAFVVGSRIDHLDGPAARLRLTILPRLPLDDGLVPVALD